MMPDFDQYSPEYKEPAPAPEFPPPPPKSPDALEFDFNRQVPYLLLAGFLFLGFALPMIAGYFAEATATPGAKSEEKSAAKSEKRLTREDIQKIMDDKFGPKKEGEADPRLVALGLAMLGGIALSLTALGLFIAGFFSKRPVIDLIPRGEKLRASWGLLACAKFIIVYLFLIVAASLALMGFANPEDLPISFPLYFDGGLKLIAVAAFGIILFAEYKTKLAEFGLGLKQILKGLWAGASGYVTFAAVIFGFMLGWAQLAAALEIEEELNPIFNYMAGGELSTEVMIAVFIATCVVAPIAEEFFFRGLLYTAIRERFGFWVAAIISSVMFGLMHQGIYNKPPTAFLGFVFAYIYERNRSLAAPMVAHAIHNAITLGMFFIMF